jgi:hypothetical protein
MIKADFLPDAKGFPHCFRAKKSTQRGDVAVRPGLDEPLVTAGGIAVPTSSG